MNELKLSIVIPAYNEEDNIKQTLNEIIQTLKIEQIPWLRMLKRFGLL